MKENLFTQHEEMGKINAALKQIGEMAKKTATLGFQTIQDYPAFSLGVGLTIYGFGGAVAGVALHEFHIIEFNTDSLKIMLTEGLLGTGLYLAALATDRYPDLVGLDDIG